jgi:hypothetical protein
LTVKIEIDDDASGVRYTQGERVSVAVAFDENEKKYAYLELVPNGGEALVKQLKFT